MSGAGQMNLLGQTDRQLFAKNVPIKHPTNVETYKYQFKLPLMRGDVQTHYSCSLIILLRICSETLTQHANIQHLPISSISSSIQDVILPKVASQLVTLQLVPRVVPKISGLVQMICFKNILALPSPFVSRDTFIMIDPIKSNSILGQIYHYTDNQSFDSIVII